MATRKKKKGKKSSFRGRIKSNAAKRKAGASFGHLRVPKGLSVFVPEPDSKVVMDILAYIVTNKKHLDKDDAVVGEQWFKAPYKTHGNIGANKDKVVCLASFGKKCPVCEYGAKRKREDADEEEMKTYKTSNRNLYAVRVLSVDGKRVKKPTVQLFDFSDYLFQEMFEAQLGDEPDFEIFPDLEEGVSIKVTFGEGSYKGNKYPEPTRFDFVKRSKPITASLEKLIPELDKCLDILPYDELKELFMEGDVDDEEEDESPRRKKKTNRKFVADDEDEDEDYDDEDEDYDDDEDDEEDEDDPDYDDEDDEEEEDEEDDDEDDEDDYDDEDDDEDDYEEPPRRKKKTARKASKKSSKHGKSSSKLKCEYGHKFGRDFDRFDDCDDCEIKRKCKIARKKK